MTFTQDPPAVGDISLIPNADEKADLNAPSGSGGKLVIGQAPNITITETTVVADAAERLALDVQEGDVAIQQNVSSSFIFTGGDNIANNWEALDFDAVGAIDGEDINPSGVSGANINTATAGEALTSDGNGGLSFAGVGGGSIVKNGSNIEYVALNVADLPSSTGGGDLALVVSPPSYVQDLPLSGTPYDITSSEFTFNQDRDTSDSAPISIEWSADGLTLFTAGFSSDTIEPEVQDFPYQFLPRGQSLGFPDTHDLDTRGFSFNNDGSKIFEASDDTDRINQLSMTVNYDLDTRSFDKFINTQDSRVRDVIFNNDGSKMYELGADLDKIYQYNLTTNFDIGTASFVTSVSTNNADSTGIVWSDDGTKLVECARSSGGVITQHDVATPYDITTMTPETTFSSQDSTPTDVLFGDNGAKFYEVGFGADKVYEYIVTTGGWTPL